MPKPSTRWPIKQFNKEFNSFAGAKARCSGTNKYARKWYGSTEFRFDSFHDFMEAIGPKPAPDAQLDRIDNSGHYEAGNIRWVCKTLQARNTRRAWTLTYNGATKHINEWACDLGLKPNTIRKRLSSGWSLEEALFTPTGAKPPSISRLVTWQGRTQPILRWERELGVPANRIRSRLDRGWTIERAFTVPV